VRKFLFKWRFVLAGGAVAVLLFSLQRLLSPGFLRADHSAPATTCKSNLKVLAAALEMYSDDHQGSYPATLSELVPRYLQSVPECPAPESQGYQAEFGRTAAHNTEGLDNYYLIQCSGAGHQGYPRNYPRYDSARGLVER